jgi:Na+-transporting methylmalonyl-CoA/oxaloacetate decarboxylase gamma subunit
MADMGSIDMGLAFKIAGGGFALVFILLTLLYFTVWLTKVITEKITKGKDK